MEQIIQDGEDFLIPPISYAVSGTQASYVVSRRQGTFFCPTPQVGPKHVRTAKFALAADEFIDLRECFVKHFHLHWCSAR